MRNLFVILISVIKKALNKSIKHSLSSNTFVAFDLKLLLENFIQCISYIYIFFCVQIALCIVYINFVTVSLS